MQCCWREGGELWRPLWLATRHRSSTLLGNSVSFLSLNAIICFPETCLIKQIKSLDSQKKNIKYICFYNFNDNLENFEWKNGQPYLGVGSLNSLRQNSVLCQIKGGEGFLKSFKEFLGHLENSILSRKVRQDFPFALPGKLMNPSLRSLSSQTLPGKECEI